MLNQVLGGHYRVIQNLGEGGLAKTYIAEDQHRPGHPKCAVKFLKPLNNDPDFLPTARRLFHQEAEILEKLGQHEQIPRLLAYFEENQEFYLVQEFVEGHTLRKELKKGKHWSESKVIQMLQDVLPILEFVHSYNVIHRDINPNNLIRRQKDGRLVLIDFGAVKQIRVPRINNTPMTQKTISIGTHGYMPIEQLRGKPRLNSDIYALGMICIQALTGVVPPGFNEDRDAEIIWQHLAEVSDELAAILSNMVRYHFPNRYQSATEVLEALRSLVNYEPIISLGSDDKPTNQILVSEEEQSSSLVSGADSFASSKNLQSIHDDQVVEYTDIEKKVPASVNDDSLIPSTIVTGRMNPKLASEKEQNSSLVSAVDSLASSQDSQSIHNDQVVQYTEIEKKIPPLVNRDFTIPSGGVTFPVTPLVAREKKKRSSLIFPQNFFVRSPDLDSTHNPIFTPFPKSLLLIGAGVVSVFVTIFAGYSYITNKHTSLEAQATLAQIEQLKDAEKYPECLQQIQAFTQDYSQLQTEAQFLQLDCQQGQVKRQLAEARELAAQSKFKDAIVLAAQVSANTNFAPEAQRLISRWSEAIFQIASNKYQEGNLPEAIAIAEAIPAFSPWTKKAQEAIGQWNKESAQNQIHLEAAQKALDEGRWQDAINTAKKISYTAYWQKQSELIIQKAKTKIANAQAATSRKKYQPSSISPPRSRSNYSRSRSVRPSRSTKKSKPTSTTIKSPSITTKSHSISIQPNSSSPNSNSPSRSDDWTCLNNPNPKCRR